MSKIGSGKFGLVEKVQLDDKTFAMKTIDKVNLSVVELIILSRIDNLNILKSVQNQQYKLSPDTYSFVTDLKHTLKNFVGMSDRNIQEMITGCIYGLSCLHHSGFLHLDIKPSNIFYTIQGGVYIPVLADFGLSVPVDDTRLGVKLGRRGTLKYIPYEVRINESQKRHTFNEESDIWSLGMTFYTCLMYPVTLNKRLSVPDYKGVIDTICTTLWSGLLERYYTQIQQDVLVDEEVVNFYLTHNKDDFMSAYSGAMVDELIEDIHNFTHVKNLYVLLDNMLQRNPETRIGTKCLVRMGYVDENLKSSCMLSANENYIVPYIDVNLFQTCLQRLTLFFNENPTLHVKLVFMALEILIKILSLLTKTCKTQKEKIFCERVRVEDYVNFAIDYTLNYYNVTKKNTMISYLNDIDIIGYNLNYAQATCLEDLVYMYKHIAVNFNLFSVFNVINTQEVIDFFKDEYGYACHTKDVTCKLFFDVVKKVKVKDVIVPTSVVRADDMSNVPDLDYAFRKKMFNYVKPRIHKKFIETSIDYISKVERYMYTSSFNEYIFNHLDQLLSMVRHLNALLFDIEPITVLYFDGKNLNNPIADEFEITKFTLIVNTVTKEISLDHFENGTHNHYFYKNNAFMAYCDKYDYNYEARSKSIVCKTDLACIIYSIYNGLNVNIALNDKTIVTMLLLLFID